MSTGPKPSPSRRTRRDHEHVGRISTQTTFIVLAAIGLIAYEIQWALLPFAVAALLAYISDPAIAWIAARSKIGRAPTAILWFLLLMSLAAAIAFLGVPPLARELMHIITDFQGTIQATTYALVGERTVDLFGQSMNANQIAASMTVGARHWIEQAGRLSTLGTIAFSGLFGTLLAAVLLFYFLLGGPRLAAGLFSLVPPQQRPLVHHIWTRLDPVLRRYFVGIIGVILYATLAAYIGLGLFLQLPHAAFLALLTGILEMIPLVGPAASAIIAGLVAIHHARSIGAIVAYAIYATALRISIDELLGPVALGAAARLHPTLVIFCFLSGGILFGIVGVIMAIPVALAVKITLATLYDEGQTASVPSGRRRQ
jgi:predicted PurR-regulated permease PerM